MRSILSVMMTALLLLSTLTACAGSRTSRVEEARTTPSPAATATVRPDSPMEDVGEAVGDAAENAGDAVGDAVSGAGEAVNDLVGDGRVTDDDGRIEDEPDATSTPGRAD